MSMPPEPPIPGTGPAGEPCHACDALLDTDQRYCLECGARRGAGGPIDFGALLATRAVVAAPATRTWTGPGGAPAPVAATMVLALLVTGILLGSLSSPGTKSAAAQRIALAYQPAPPAPVAPVLAPAPVPAPMPVVPVPVTPPAPVQPVQPAAPGVTATPPATTGDDTTPVTDDDTTTGGDDGTSPIKHVFVIMLADQSAPSAFAAGSGAPFLSEKLVPDGTLVRDLRTISGSGLANAIALVSGQGPNPQTAAGCPTYADVAPATVGKEDQEEGEGCVYSVQTATLANQLERAEKTWRAYVEDQGNGGDGVASTCRHPELGTADPWRDPRPGDAFATARNPFVYFHAIVDAPECAKRVVGLDELDADLKLASDKAPALSYIVPDMCHDGRAAPCAPGVPAGPAAADAFLSEVVPKIRDSKLFAQSLLIVTFDRAAPVPAPAPDPAAPVDPAAPAPSPAYAEGGDKVGALLLSPFVRKGRTVTGRRDTYSLMATIARILALDPLGKAARPDAKPLGESVVGAGAAAAP